MQKEQREKEEENFLRNLTWGRKEPDNQIQETPRIPKKMNLKRPTPRPIINNMSKFKDKETIKSSKKKKKQPHNLLHTREP